MTKQFNKLRRGFSLIEMVFSLGLLAVAVSCWLAVLPGALRNGADAARTGMAGMIAESLSAELGALGKIRAAGETVTLAMDGAAEQFIALDDDGNILGTVSATAFADGEASAKFIAAVRFADCEPERAGLVTLSVAVEWPGAAPRHARRSQTFCTLVTP